MRLMFCFFILVLTCPAGNARVNIHKLTTFPVYINYADSSQKASVLNAQGRIRPKQDAFYYWYANNTIHVTQGGFSGKLLHGTYTAFHPSHNLKTQGQFNHGLKTGKWITWYASGRIHEIIYYSHGEAHGLQEIYDASGNIKMRTYYRNGVKHGKTTYYTEGKIDSTVCFKRGMFVPIKECQDSVSRKSILKRKRTDSVHDKDNHMTDSTNKVKVKKEKRMARDSSDVKNKEADTTRNRFRKIFHPRKKTN